MEGKKLLRFPQVLEKVGLSSSEIKRRIAAGNFPKSVPIGDRLRAWDADEIDQWILARIAERDKSCATFAARAA